jgi:hypothetical protein
MKKIKILTAFFALISILACEQEEENINNIYDPTSGQSLTSFSSSSSDLAVVIDGVGTVDVMFEVSSVSTSDRTISVSINEESTANPENYTLASNTVVIPANQHMGVLTIDGVDMSVETAPETIILDIADTSYDTVYNRSSHTVNIFQVCPIPADYFVGTYLLEQVSAYVDGPTLSDGATVEVVASGDTSRSFSTETYPDYCGGSFLDFRVNLVCNEFVVPNQDTICRCNEVSDWFGPAVLNDSYDLSDDSELFITFTDDQQSDCGAPAQTRYKLTKIL